MLKLAVPWTAFMETLSPMPRMAPPSEGRERLGSLEPGAKALPSPLLDLKSLLLGAVVPVSAWIAIGLGLLGPATAHGAVADVGALGLMIGRSPFLRRFP
jgi:hypothetical protein